MMEKVDVTFSRPRIEQFWKSKELIFSDGSAEIFCWCGEILAGKMLMSTGKLRWWRLLKKIEVCQGTANTSAY